MTRVFVTGIGLITPVGIGNQEVWNRLLAGESGAGLITRFDTTDFTTRIAAEVKEFQAGDFMDRKEAKRMDRFAQYAVAASRIALEDSGLNLSEVDPTRAGVVVSSGIGGLETLESQYQLLLEKGASRVSPFLIPMMIGNMAAGQVAMTFGMQGPANNVVSACASGAQAIGEALRLMQLGIVDVVLAGGSEAAITPLGLAGFCSARALSTRNDDPARASRPFDKQRDGFLMGEGAAVVVLESERLAKKREARVYAELKGYAVTNDAYHVTAPHPEAVAATNCLRTVLSDANMAPEDIDYINAHGTSTPLNDRLETLAIKQSFGQHAHRLAISSTKSMVGHLLGAAGALETALAAWSVYADKVHPTINLEEGDPDCDLDYVPNQARSMRVRAAISTSLGFGGHNCSVLLAKPH